MSDTQKLRRSMLTAVIGLLIIFTPATYAHAKGGSAKTAPIERGHNGGPAFGGGHAAGAQPSRLPSKPVTTRPDRKIPAAAAVGVSRNCRANNKPYDCPGQIVRDHRRPRDTRAPTDWVR